MRLLVANRIGKWQNADLLTDTKFWWHRVDGMPKRHFCQRRVNGVESLLDELKEIDIGHQLTIYADLMPSILGIRLVQKLGLH